MGKEAYSVGLKVEESMEPARFPEEGDFLVHGSGSNVQWVFVVQDEEDAITFDCFPTRFATILNAVNLEMIERPALLDPSVLAEQWEVTTVKCRMAGAEQKLMVMSFAAFASHVQEVQGYHFSSGKYSGL